MRKVVFSLSVFLLIFIITANSNAQEDKLLKAYKREYMFLVTQKKALTEELNRLKEELSQIKAQNKKEIEKLQNQLLLVKSKADKIEKLIEEIDSQLIETEENTQLIQATINQAKETLHSYKIEIPEKKSEETTLKIIFDKTSSLLKDLSSLKVFNDTFFLQNGEKITGKVLKVGAIARYAVAKNEEAGALIPAGDGYFTLWTPKEDKTLAETSKELINGENPNFIGIFLYENENKAVEPPKEYSFKEFLKSGGIIGYIILALGAIGIVFILIRTFLLFRAGLNTKSVTQKVVQLIKEDKLEEAIEFSEKKAGIIPKVIAYILKNINKDRESIEYLITEAIVHYSGKLDLFKNTILVIAAVSPLLGLLGTVTGIIETFHVITEYGTGDPKLMAGGISEALVTTELGLAVAIPMYILGSLLNGWSERIKELIEEATLKIINIYDEEKGINICK